MKESSCVVWNTPDIQDFPIPTASLSTSHQISFAGQAANKARKPRRDFHFNLLPKMPTDFDEGFPWKAENGQWGGGEQQTRSRLVARSPI